MTGDDTTTGDHIADLGKMVATTGADEAAMVEALPAMPPTDDVRPSADKGFEIWQEPLDDWVTRNHDAVDWLADNHVAIRAALTRLTTTDVEAENARLREAGKTALAALTAETIGAIYMDDADWYTQVSDAVAELRAALGDA